MINFENRLKSLKERRQGSRERALYESMESIAANNAVLKGVDVRRSEGYENLKEPVGVKYAIGAMAPVDSKSTEVSINEGNRVADSLIKSLNSRGEDVTKRLQGSVALDIHIKGHSDVDMLIVVNNPINYEIPVVSTSNYTPATDPRPLINIIRDVRNKSEIILQENFPAAYVDCHGNKSIALSGGSLARKVDIVPAIWFDSIKYQKSWDESDRGIKIYHKDNHEFILNYPFNHIKKVNIRDAAYSGNLKCVVRLLKNIVADMPEDKNKIAKKISSYDLASIAYHMGDSLSMPSYMRLGLIEKTRLHLSCLLQSRAYRDLFLVPDESRKIFDNDDKVAALEILTNECTDLAKEIFKELRPYSSNYDSSVLINKSVM
ncbi:hypothetical protein [Shewanella baltica]|uniref:hypothetical protein n=1 Tax=Shewanella baltica TaxID=62322 RepID=UPI00217E37C3|nr:hypothetical protein [Shewanella baltica]MCS6125002.1 hypothetical protein [Shewanella baltica]